MDNILAFDMDNISRIKVLTREEERELLRMALNGDIKARNKIVEHNLRLVAYVAKSYARNEDTFMELYTEGYTVLFHAIDRFDLSKETKFSTYATWWIRQAMSKYLRNRCNDGQIYDIEIENKNNECFESSEIIKLIRDCLYILTDREADIIKRRFGIGCEEETLDQIGTDYNLSKERIRQVQEKAMEKMEPLLRSCI
jgi:RNA polymerase sigma factor (sigma-70 family)